jgi:hypothetical protein
VAGIAISFPNYGNLAPGQTAETEGFYVVNIAPNCTNKEIRVDVNIASEGFVLWRDSLTISVLTVGVAERKSGAPARFFLEQNYPNPFNPETKINYQLPKSGRVVLKIFNILGREVRALVDEFKPAGSFDVRWDGMDNAGQRAPSGVYLYRIEAEGLALTRRMVMLQEARSNWSLLTKPPSPTLAGRLKKHLWPAIRCEEKIRQNKKAIPLIRDRLFDFFGYLATRLDISKEFVYFVRPSTNCFRRRRSRRGLSFPPRKFDLFLLF